MTRTIDVSDLPAPLVAAIEAMVNTYRSKARANTARPAPPTGWLKGRWELPDTFFEPLPEDLLELFNGNGAAAASAGDTGGTGS